MRVLQRRSSEALDDDSCNVSDKATKRVDEFVTKLKSRVQAPAASPSSRSSSSSHKGAPAQELQSAAKRSSHTARSPRVSKDYKVR